MNKSFAIVVICYNRLEVVKRLVSSLENVDYDQRTDINLIFSIDNSGSDIVEKFANDYVWNFGKKMVRTFPQRQGLKKHVLQCGDYTEQYDIVTVLEDDIYVSDSMYNYAYAAANFYWYDENIAGISLYSYQKNWLKWLCRFEPQKTKDDAFFMKIAMSWGQVWTKQKWFMFRKWLSENERFIQLDDIPSVLNLWPETSWLKYHDLYCIKNNKYFVYPYVSVSTNCSAVGEHAQYAVTDHQVELMYGKSVYSFPEFRDAKVIYDEFMERENLGKYVGVDDNELTVDIWGNKPKKHYKRYVLTTDSLPYKICKSFSLSLRPAELSIINGFQGDEIHLYDTSHSVPQNGSKRNSDFLRYRYSIRSNDYRSIMKFSIHLSRQFFPDVKRKIKKLWGKIAR